MSSLEKLVTFHAKELHGTLFMKVATDDDRQPPILLGAADLETCKAVVRRIVRNAIRTNGERRESRRG